MVLRCAMSEHVAVRAAVRFTIRKSGTCPCGRLVEIPLSSSAHVVVADKLPGLDASAPPMLLLLVALHTSTMFAVIAHF